MSRLPLMMPPTALLTAPVATPSVSVVVCAYTEERWDDLLRCVAALRAQTAPPDEIVVVIDHNERLYTRALEALTGVHVIENSDARGLSGARNSGILQTSGEAIAFIDEDAVANVDWLECLRDGYQNPSVVGVGGAITPAWETGRPRWFPEEFDWVVGCTYRGMPTVAVPVRNLIGCNMSFRRTVFTEIGGFRNGIGRIGVLPVGCEETELCIRVRQAWPQSILLYEPRAGVRHRVPQQRGAWRYFRARCYAEGLSKALVAQLVGTADGLASERTYTLRTLPQGVVHSLTSFWRRADMAGPARAAAIVAGLAITTAGYARGRATQLLNAQVPSAPGIPRREPAEG